MRWRNRSSSAGSPEPEQRPKEREEAEPSRWEFEVGDPIAPGRSVLKRLGGGTRYEVYLSWDDRLCSLVVAKILRPDQTEDARALQELEREAEILGRLAHPVVLRGFDAILEGPHPHLVVEHLEGPTLRRLIKRQRRLPLEQVLPTAVHIALSTEQVVHRLAPEEPPQRVYPKTARACCFGRADVTGCLRVRTLNRGFGVNTTRTGTNG